MAGSAGYGGFDEQTVELGDGGHVHNASAVLAAAETTVLVGAEDGVDEGGNLFVALVEVTEPFAVDQARLCGECVSWSLKSGVGGGMEAGSEGKRVYELGGRVMMVFRTSD